MSRLRRVETQQEFERVVDDYITQGYKVKSRGQASAQLHEADYGTVVAHILIFVFFGWWTLGLANLIYLGYKYWSSESVTVKLDNDSPQQGQPVQN